MNRLLFSIGVCLLCISLFARPIPIEDQKPNTWVKRSPLPGGPLSPRLGYESSWGYHPQTGLMLRWGAHDPGNGGPQLSEVWTFNPDSCAWYFVRTNNNPPGNCCCRDNVMVPDTGLFYRFSYPAFGHGWYWERSRFLREDAVWTFDLRKRQWRNMRPGRQPCLNTGKPAFHDPVRELIWVYDFKLRAYDYKTNAWTQVNHDKVIGKRTYAGMALEPEAGKILLFGDHYNPDPRTWIYNIASDSWTDMKPKVSPPGIRSCPSIVYDSRNKKFVAIVLADRFDTKDPTKRRLETWTYDLRANAWTKMNPPHEPDYSGARNRLLSYLPDRNIIIMENRTRKEQQIWTYRLANPTPQAQTKPVVLQASIKDNGEVLFKATGDWKQRPVFSLFRAQGREPWKLNFTEVSTGELNDSQLKHGKLYHYYVEGRAGDNTYRSKRIRLQPDVILDSRVDVSSASEVLFSWKPSQDPNVIGYVVERALVRTVSAAQKHHSAKQYAPGIDKTVMVEKAAFGEFERLTPRPIARNQFIDKIDLSITPEIKKVHWRPYFGPKGLAGNRSYDMSKPGCKYAVYAYRVRAVNRLGVESGPSPYQLTIANEVENFYGKEEGKNVRLRWQASPHQGIRGYLVYRLNEKGDKRISRPILQRLTPEPIRRTSYFDTDTVVRDKEIGGHRARYYVVVVDALGQEGIPSHPVWAFRPWRRHYAPWLPADKWHQ